jgi:hypothetical protein
MCPGRWIRRGRKPDSFHSSGTQGLDRERQELLADPAPFVRAADREVKYLACGQVGGTVADWLTSVRLGIIDALPRSQPVIEQVDRVAR